MHSSGQPSGQLSGQPSGQRPRPTARTLATVYGGASVVWMALSEWLMLAIAPKWDSWSLWQSLKPWLDIALATGLLYYLLRRYEYSPDSPPSNRPVPSPDPSPVSSPDPAQEPIIAPDQAVRLQQILTTMPVMLDAFDADGNVVFWNQECERVTGYCADEIINNPQAMALIYPDPDYRHQMLQQWNTLGNRYRNWECELTGKDGTRRIIAWSNLSDDFPVSGWKTWGIGVDVTEYRRVLDDRARIEQALRASESKVRSLVQDVDVGIVLHGGRSEILLCNQTAQDWLGRTAAELISKTWLDHDWSSCREDGSPFLRQDDPVAVAIAAHQPVRNVVMGIERKTQGDRVWLLVSAVPQIDESGILHYIVSSFSNITAQKQAEAALKAERDLLTSIMNTSVAAIMVLNPSGQITYANESAERVVGLTRTDIASRTYNAPDWKHTDLDGGPWPHEKQPFVQVMTTGLPVFDVQHAIETQTGERKYLSINGAPIKDPQGTITSLVFSVNDITDRFLAERALEHREQYFKALTEHSSDIVVLLDRQGRFRYVTPSTERVLGYSPDVVVGHHATDFVHPDDVATILTVLDNAIRKPRQSQPLVEYRVRHANNSYRTFEAVTTSLLDDPIVQGVVVNCRDVTDRKQAEEALQDSEERYRSVVSLLTEGVVLHAVDGTIVAHNASAESILGMSMAEMTRHRQIEDPVWYLTYEDGSILPADQMPAAITLRTGEPQTGVTLGFRRPDGEFRWLMVNSQPLLSPDETSIRGAVVSFSDITERRQQQQALQQSEEKFRSLTHCAPIGIYMVDADGYGTWVNPRLQAIAGFTLEESLDLGWSHFIHPEDLQRLQRHWQDCYTHGLPYDGEYRFLQRDGTIRWVHETTTAMYDDQGNLIGHVGAIEDITERKQAEEALAQSETRLRLALEASNITCWEYDLRSAQVEGMGRMSHGHWVAEPWRRSLNRIYALVHSDDRDRLRQEVAQAIATSGELISEYRICLPGQSPRWMLLRGRVVTETEGNQRTTRLVGVSIDIDNLKQAEASIQQLNAALAQQNSDLEALVEQRTSELTTFFNALPDRVFVIDRRDMRIVFSNDLHAWHNFGASSGKEICGKTIFECFPPERAAHLAEQNDQVFTTGEVMRIQHDYKVGDRTVYMDTYKIPLKRPNGEVY
ncbi:MAG TPA: PAS domain S-box protein, partial [Chroococcidiopsis sp.]